MSKSNSILTKNRDVFGVEDSPHNGHMKSIKQSVLDGTSKWSAKIAITGLSIETGLELLLCPKLQGVLTIVPERTVEKGTSKVDSQINNCNIKIKRKIFSGVPFPLPLYLLYTLFIPNAECCCFSL